MSITVLILSLVAAVGQAMLSVNLLKVLPGIMPLPLAVGCVFATGMLLSFLLIIVIGVLGLTSHAADFVHDHMGRVLALALIATIIVFALGTGGEAVYEIKGGAKQKKTADLMFVLDYSTSMNNALDTGGQTRFDGLCAAFGDVVNGLEPDQRISVVRYEEYGHVLLDWTAMSDANRRKAIDKVRGEEPDVGVTNYWEGLKKADELVKIAVKAGRPVAVVMISDGEAPEVDVSECAPTIHARKVPVYTLGIGNDADADVSYQILKSISEQTGGQLMISANDLADISENFQLAVESAVADAAGGEAVSDTVLSPMTVGRSTSKHVRNILMLLLASLVFRMIVNICVGNNASNMLPHLLSALALAGIGTAAVLWFGGSATMERAQAVMTAGLIYWPLMMVQLVFNNR